MMWNWGYGQWWMGLLMILFWAGVIALIVWAIRSAGDRSRDQDQNGSDQALRILERRYAQGEIDDEEFQRRRDLLGRRS